MAKHKYIDKAFRSATLEVIKVANKIVEEYVNQGFDLTLRQLYYQMVARGYIENSDRSYKNLGNTINDARLAGLIDWRYIVDRTRNLRVNPHWNSPASIIRSAAASYQIDKWIDQPFRVEVWIEKDALIGVIAGICAALDVPYFACRGYTSQSEMWSAGQRLLLHRARNQTPVILHLGDHDPSGIDMTRDIIDRLEMFAGEVKVERLALNMDQVETYNPPPNPAKLSDTRADAYIAEFGWSSWELDALDPITISRLIENAVNSFRDAGLWAEKVAEERIGLELLESVSDNWTALVDFLESSQE